MSSSTTHPLADAWLRDLELLLHGIDPGERAEVLVGVREHLDGSLPPDASDDEVRRVLADLGSPQSVADEAYADRPTGTRPTATTTATATAIGSPDRSDAFDTPSRRWVVLAAAALLTFDFVVLALGAALGGMGLVLLTFIYLTGPLWIVASAMVLTSRRLWTAAQKVVIVALTPAAYLLVALSSIALLNNGWPSHLIPWVGPVLVIGGAGWILARTVRRGLARAT